LHDGHAWFGFTDFIYANDIDRKRVLNIKRKRRQQRWAMPAVKSSWSSTALTVKWKHFLFLSPLHALQHP
jgi:hypothetical protein